MTAVAPVAALLPLAAVTVLLIRSGALKNMLFPPEPTPYRKVDMFINRMVHKTCYENYRFVSFRVDCFLFDFKPWHPDGLDEKIQYGFLDYTRTLDLANQQAIVKMMMWLIQKDVKFRLRYQWNTDLPVCYNIGQMPKPRKLRKLVGSIDHGLLMDYDLSKDTHALHP